MELNSKYQQVEFAKHIYENGYNFENNHKWFYPMFLLAIYLRDFEGMKPKEREKFMYEYFEKYKSNYDKVLDYRDIDKILSLAKNKTKFLRQVSAIVITKAERDYIKELKVDDRDKKIIFSCLCAYKIDVAKSQKEKSTYIISDSTMSFKQIKNFANITLKKSEIIEDVIRRLIELELLEITKKTNLNAVFVSKIDNNVVDNEVVYELESFENFGLQWERLNGEKRVICCEECYKIFKIKPTVRKFPKCCSVCTKNKDLLYQKNYNESKRKATR